MKVQLLMLGVLFCLAAQAAGNPGQVAQVPDKSNSVAQQSLTGCIDEQDGNYVLLDAQMLKIVNLQSAGSDKEVFAKHLGHNVQVKGTKSSGQEGSFKVSSIERLAGECGKAK